MLKKKNTIARCNFIAHKFGTIERGIWVEYFNKHPTDLPKVLKLLSTEHYKSTLRKDIRNRYRNPGYDAAKAKNVMSCLELGDFVWYAKKNQYGRVFTSLSDVPIM